MTVAAPAPSEDTPEDAPKAPPKKPRNLVNTRNFPHAKVKKCWIDSRLPFAKAAYKENEKDYRDALQDLCGPNKEVAETDGQITRDKKFAGPMFTSDYLKLVSFFSNREPKTTCRSADGFEGKPYADATAALSDRCALECGEKEQDAYVIGEAICRNHGYVRCGWDNRRWLPTFKHVKGELLLDPNCEGDIKAARWSIEVDEMDLSILLDDPDILEEHKKVLRDKTDCHRKSRIMQDGAISSVDAEKDYATDQNWDGDAGMARVTTYKIFSRIGLQPGWNVRDDEPEAGEASLDEAPSSSSRDKIQPGSPHEVFRPPPEIPEDAAPTAQMFDPQDAGRRVYILMVAGFDKVLKVTDWPLDHYDHDEIPYVECRPIAIPGLLHGMNIYRMIRPYMKIVNDAIEYWIASEKAGAKRITEVEDGIEPTELAKLESDNLREVMKVPRRGMMGTVEFAGRLTSFKEMIPFFIDQHDKTTGINDAVSGQSPQVEETAHAAKARMDQAVAAISYIENAVDAYHEKKARMRVAALQRYVPRETVYAPCEHCDGAGIMGFVPESIDPMTGQPMPIPCEECRGTGNGRILKKGARFWIRKLADAWRDDLTLDEIRAEVIVGVEPGSSRTDYTERQLNIATSIADRYVPLYGELGLPQKQQAVIDMHIRASGASNPESLIATVEELEQANKARMQAMAAAGQKTSGKSPEEIQIAAMTAQHEMAMREKEVALAEKKAQADVALRSQQIGVQQQQVQVQAMQVEAQREAAERQAMTAAAPKEPPPVDPIKALDVQGRLEIEREKLAIDREKMEAEFQARAAENAQKASEVETNAAQSMAESAQSQDVLAQVQTALAEQEKRITESFESVLKEIAAAVATAGSADGAKKEAADNDSTLKALLKALTAPKTVTTPSGAKYTVRSSGGSSEATAEQPNGGE